jgi:osmotically-inducible protein OsmY
MTDADIFVAVRNALDQRPAVPATVRVHIDKGIATLTGTVRLASERTEAEGVVRRVAGVQRVVNGISVDRRPNEEGFEPPAE